MLVLAASDFFAFSSEDSKEWAYMIIRELAPISPRESLETAGVTGDGNIDYDKSCIRKNMTADCS